MKPSGSGDSLSIVKSVEPQVGLAALRRASRLASSSPTMPTSLRDTIAREERRVAADQLEGDPGDRLVAGPVLAILLDPVVVGLAGEQRDTRLRQIIQETRPAPRRAIRVLAVLAFLAAVVGVGASMMFGVRHGGFVPMIGLTLCFGAMLWVGRPSASSKGDVRIGIGEARQLAAIAEGELPSGAVPNVPRTVTVADVRQAVDDLLGEWGKYQLDIEAWYVTKPLLHDTTGTVVTTVAYERAMQALIAAVDDLAEDAAQDHIDAAVKLADAAWDAWHAADEYAAEVGLGDRTPSERAALQRLGRLVERLARSAATDPELPMVKRSIQDCLDRISTVSVSWADIAMLPAIEAAGLLPQIPARHQSNVE